VGKSISRVSSE